MSNSQMESGGQLIPPCSASAAFDYDGALLALKSGASLAEAAVDDRESELIARIRNRDEKALELLFERHKATIKSLALRYMRNDEEAEDVTMEVFEEKVWGPAFASFNEGSRLRTWLYTVTVRHCLNKLRKVSPFPMSDFRKNAGDVATILTWLDAEDSGPLPSDIAFGKELLAVLDTFLEELPQLHRAAFILKGIDGLTESEAAKRINCSIPQFRGYFNRAQKALRKRIAPYL